MADLTAFYDYVMPNLPGLGTELALQAIRETAIDFCERSLLYSFEHPAIDIIAGTHSYTLTPEAGTRLVDILSVRYQSTPLTGASEDALDDGVLNWRTTATGAPEYFLSTVERTQIRLVKTPSESVTGGLEVTLAQAPVISATTVPDWLLERYREAIQHGTFQRLFAMHRKPWTDRELSVYHGHRFDQEIGRANTSKAKGHTRQRLRTKACFR